MEEFFQQKKILQKLQKLESSIDNKSLFSLNWKFGKQSSWKDKSIDLGQLKQLKKEWIEKAESNSWITPKARFILLPAQSEGDEVILYHPEDTEKELKVNISNNEVDKLIKKYKKIKRKQKSNLHQVKLLDSHGRQLNGSR